MLHVRCFFMAYLKVFFGLVQQNYLQSFVGIVSLWPYVFCMRVYSYNSTWRMMKVFWF